ncbi:MFS transporter [Streptomyces sp. NPDC091376]|uniref:MFS transporter n=1 Tax=Streptomyces sp. NPDC091376 TaxID=3365994 RepID=UPI003815F2E1
MSWIKRGGEKRPGFTARERAAVYGAGVAVLVVQLDWFAVNVTLPLVAREFATSVTDLHWVLSGFLVAYGASVTVAGWAADTLGRRETVLCGLLVFTVASVACSTAQNPGWLVAGRISQGVGGGLVVPAAIALTAARFPDDRRGPVMGTVLGLAGAGVAMGPFVGGVLAQAAGWRAVFYANIPVCAVAACLIVVYVPVSARPPVRSRFPWWGVALSVTGVVGLLVSTDRAEAWGWYGTAAGVLASAVLLFAFYAVERRGERPLFGPEVLRDGRLIRVSLTGATGTAAFGVVSLFAAVYVHGREASSLAAGLALLALSVPDAVGAGVAGRLASRKRGTALMAWSLAALSMAMAGLAFARAVPVYLVLLAVSGLCMGLAVGLSTALVQTYVPHENLGAAASFSLAVKMTITAVVLSLAAASYESLPSLMGPGSALSPAGVILCCVAFLALCAAASFLPFRSSAADD